MWVKSWGLKVKVKGEGVLVKGCCAKGNGSLAKKGNYDLLYLINAAIRF